MTAAQVQAGVCFCAAPGCKRIHRGTGTRVETSHGPVVACFGPCAERVATEDRQHR